MTQLTPSAEQDAVQDNAPALYLDGVKFELTNTAQASNYSVNLVTEYSVPVITVYYQANTLRKPVEVAHVYVQPEQGFDENPRMRAWMNDFNNALTASIAYALHGGLSGDEEMPIFSAGDTAEMAKAIPLDTKLPSAMSFFHAVPFTDDSDPSEEPTIYAFSQIFQLAADPDVPVPNELKGYDAGFVQAAVCAVTDIPDLRDRPAYIPPAQSLKALLDIADRGLYFSSMDAVSAFNPPHTDTLGNWAMSEHSRPRASILGFPKREHVKEAKRKAGIKEKPTASQLG